MFLRSNGLAPGSVEQRDGRGDALALIAESCDEGSDCGRGVLAREGLRVKRGLWAPAGIAGNARRE